jgi:hypothetical protein
MNKQIRILPLAFSLIFSVSCFGQKAKKNDDSTRIAQSFGSDFEVVRQGNDFVLNKKTPLTVGEFAWYQWYVRDSVSLERYYEFASEYLYDYQSQKVLNNSAEQKRQLKLMDYPDYRAKRQYGTLNFAFLQKRYKRHNELDYVMKTRKILVYPVWRFFLAPEYEYQDDRLFFRPSATDSTAFFSIHTNHWVLAENSKHAHDLTNILAKVYPVLFKQHPVVGIEESHIRGFEKFMTRRINNCLKTKGLKYQATIESKFIDDTISVEVPRNELIKNWKIELDEYADFLNYVRDSTIREFLYFNIQNLKKAEKFIRYKNQYLDVDCGEWVDTDPVEKEINREYFPLNFKRKINRKDKEIDSLLSVFNTDKKLQNLYFQYDGFDAKKYKVDTLVTGDHKFIKYLGHFTETIYLAPTNSDYYDEDTISAIYKDMKYHQALAFYNWKFPIRKVMSFTKSWTQYIFPSEEEYGYLQRGELDKIKDIRASIPIQAVQMRVVLKAQVNN